VNSATPQVIERRKNPTSDHAIMLDIVKQTRDDVHELKTQLLDHIKMEEEMTATLVQDLLAKSFPEGNPELHRIYHENLIKASEEKAKFWSKMAFELTKGGLLVFAAWALLELWLAFLRGPKP
jgi:hypothetical protein